MVIFPEFVLDGVSQRVMKTEEGEAADLAEDGRQRGWHHHHHCHRHRHHHHHHHRHRRRRRRRRRRRF